MSSRKNWPAARAKVSPLGGVTEAMSIAGFAVSFVKVGEELLQLTVTSVLAFPMTPLLLPVALDAMWNVPLSPMFNVKGVALELAGVKFVTPVGGVTVDESAYVCAKRPGQEVISSSTDEALIVTVYGSNACVCPTGC